MTSRRELSVLSCSVLQHPELHRQPKRNVAPSVLSQNPSVGSSDWHFAPGWRHNGPQCCGRRFTSNWRRICMKSKTGGKTKTSRQNQADARLKDLNKLLARARQEVLARVRVLRKEEQDDAVELPADDLDVARSLEDIETDAGLIDR